MPKDSKWNPQQSLDYIRIESCRLFINDNNKYIKMNMIDQKKYIEWLKISC